MIIFFLQNVLAYYYCMTKSPPELLEPWPTLIVTFSVKFVFLSFLCGQLMNFRLSPTISVTRWQRKKYPNFITKVYQKVAQFSPKSIPKSCPNFSQKHSKKLPQRRYWKSVVSKTSPKLPIIWATFVKILCLQNVSKIAQSGHTVTDEVNNKFLHRVFNFDNYFWFKFWRESFNYFSSFRRILSPAFKTF